MLNRRDAMLRLGQLGLGTLTLPQLLSAESVTKPKATAKSCILIYLWGGPPQQDMWDMKPTAPVEIRGEFQPIDTSLPGVQFSEHLPRLARHRIRRSERSRCCLVPFSMIYLTLVRILQRLARAMNSPALGFGLSLIRSHD